MTTCFMDVELYLAEKEAKRYWEIDKTNNLSRGRGVVIGLQSSDWTSTTA